MAFAETAPLIARLELKDAFSGPLKKASSALTTFGTRADKIGQGFRTVGTGLGIAARNLALIGVAAAGGLAAGLIKSVREGQEAAKVQTIFANAVMNSGRVSTEYVAILKKQQIELMNLAGIDDELIKTEQTRLIQMNLTGDQVAKLTPLILDLSKATGKDLLTSTLAVGKAANGNATSLQRFGVFVDKAKFKVDPFTATMEALNQKFGGTTKALSGSLEARMGAFRANLANIREEAGIKLLPALTRIVDVAGRDLVPAFGKLVDRILPGVVDGIERFAAALEDGGAERGIKGITDALGPMIELLKIAAAPVKAIVGAFLSLPSQVQGVLIGGFAINKLSGGLIGKGIGQIAGGVTGGLFQRGNSPANPLFVSAVGGLGAGGAVAGAAGKGAGLLGVATKVFLVGAAIGAFAELKGILDEQSARNRGQIGNLTTQTTTFAGKAPVADLSSAIRGISATQDRLNKELSGAGLAFQLDIDGVRTAIESQKAILVDKLSRSERSVPPITNVKVEVNVTAAQVSKSVVVQKRFGPSGGSRERGSTEFDA